ncbi:hypothetical protein V3W47_12970 [Deinococcus sp. YIM 134068]|uniref:hypothetical protein n=1 Tax=Deinococcus lichenicola TaxID=3118910 RepID=UPI002F95D667
MTAPKELHEQIDRLSPEGQERLRAFLERQEKIERHLAALEAFSTGWTPEEEAAFEQALSRRVQLRHTDAETAER